jgi:hypothetical protein
VGRMPEGKPRALRFLTDRRSPTRATFFDRRSQALRALEHELIGAPERAHVIEHTGGLRKLRFAPPGLGRGKSGAYQVCYAYFPAFGTVALFVAFGKNERADLSPAEARAIAKALKAFEAELRRQFEQPG